MTRCTDCGRDATHRIDYRDASETTGRRSA